MIGFWDGFWFTFGVVAASFVITIVLAILGLIANQMGISR